jgi:hypothetical protein
MSSLRAGWCWISASVRGEPIWEASEHHVRVSLSVIATATVRSRMSPETPSQMMPYDINDIDGHVERLEGHR